MIVGVSVDPHRRQLHLTLSHQYTAEHHSTLEELARTKIDPQSPAKWELRLYSRDPRQGSSEVSDEGFGGGWGGTRTFFRQ